MNSLGIGWEGVADMLTLPAGCLLYQTVFDYIGRFSSPVPQSWRELGGGKETATHSVPNFSQCANASSMKRH
jgi:hypothetical protein